MPTPLYPKILEQTLKTGEQKAKGFCTSKQLRRLMNRKTILATAQKATGVVNSPHYWAVYYHIGRKNLPPITPKSANVLVWFKDPRDDPRLTNGQSPVYRSEVRRLNLSAQQFRALRKAGKLIVTKRSPRSGPAKFNGNPFFSNTGGMQGMDARLKSISQREAYKHVESWLRQTGLKKKTIRRSL